MPEDRYANMGGIEVIESGANTLTFAEKLTGVGFNTKKGMLIDQIDYFIPNATQLLLLGNADMIRFALTVSSSVDDLEDVGDSRILHSGSWNLQSLSSVGFNFIKMPLSFQFFPSLIHAQQRIFLGVQGSSLASAATVRARFYWRFVDLNDRDISELVQATLIQG